MGQIIVYVHVDNNDDLHDNNNDHAHDNDHVTSMRARRAETENRIIPISCRSPRPYKTMEKDNGNGHAGEHLHRLFIALALFCAGDTIDLDWSYFSIGPIWLALFCTG